MYNILREVALDSSATMDQQDFILNLFVLLDQLDRETKTQQLEAKKQYLQRVANNKEAISNDYNQEILVSLPRVSTVTPGFVLCKPFFSSSDKSRGFQ